MKQRIITALILAPIAICGIFFLPLQFFMLACAGLFLLASKEWAGFVDKTAPSFILYFYGALLGLTLAMMPIGDMWTAKGINPAFSIGLIVAAVWWVVALLMVCGYPQSANVWRNKKSLKTLFGLLTLIPFFWGMVALRSVNMQHDFYFGSELVMFVFLLVWAADTGAYFVGKKFGKRKLAPKVSPGKTIEGFLGGLIFAVIIAFLGVIYFEVEADHIILFLVASLVTTLVSALGDLTESVFKRESGLKDSSNLLPGHGGILDRIDSLTAAVPVFALFYLTWLS